ncbi:MAG: mercuric transport protein MerTP [Flavobacteriales bacterium]
MDDNKNKVLLGTSSLAALGSSLCCIIPALVGLGSLAGFASSLSWLIEPFRPYLMGFTVVVLGFAWFQRLKPSKKEDGNCCDTEEKPSFKNSKKFLTIITVFAAVMLTFPYYSGMFIKKSKAQTAEQTEGTEKCEFKVEGMTCTGCEKNVNSTLKKQKGVHSVSSSYEKGKASIVFDSSEVSKKDLAEALEKETHYKVKNSGLMEEGSKD